MFASALCFIDCTVLPAMLAALPVLGFLSPTNSQWIHDVLHSASVSSAAIWCCCVSVNGCTQLYVVLPIGGVALATNFAQHKRWDVTAVGAAGLGVIMEANTHYLGLIPHDYHHIVRIASY